MKDEEALSGEHAEARRVLLVDPPPGLGKAVLHVLRCGSCRNLLTSVWRRASEAAPDPRLSPGKLWERIGPAVVEKLRRAEEARDLLATVMAAPAEARPALLADGRSASEELLEMVLMRARDEDPEGALYLTRLASELVGRLQGELDEEDLEEFRGEAEVIAGNAWRRLGQYEAAEQAFNRASGRPEPGPRTAAALCRWEGVLWWELGHFCRAEALLRQSARILGEQGSPDEEGVARVLLGLFLAERGEAGRCLPLLQAGRACLDPEEWPWLAVQARMALAWEMARQSPERARRILEPEVGSEQQAVLDDPRGQWLEGRVRSRMGDRERGERLLETARVRLLPEHNVAHSALCSLDLTALLIEDGRAAEVEGLVTDFAVWFSRESAVLESLQGLGQALLEAFERQRAGGSVQAAEGSTSPDARRPGLGGGLLGRFDGRLRRVLRSAGHSVLLPF